MKSTRKKTKKHRELERAKAREEKRAELVEEYKELQKLVAEFKWLQRLPDEEIWVNRKLEEWDRQQLKDASGKYQDELKISSEYQQHFAKYMQECCPKVFEELRVLTTYFERLFGEDRDKFHFVFDRFKNEFLFDLQTDLDKAITSCVFKKYDFLRFRTRIDDYKTFRFDFYWGEYRPVLLFSRLLFATDRTTEQWRGDYEAACKYVEENLSIYGVENLPDDFDRSLIPPFISAQAQSAVLQLIEAGQKNYFAYTARAKFEKFLEEVSNGDESQMEYFIQLQIELIDWAKEHNLEKDWLLRYGYYFLSQFCESPDIEISKITIPALQVRKLVGWPFEFKFNGWFAGDETKEAYEIRLRKAFEEEVTRYFHNTVNQLNLDKLKNETSPRKYKRVKWLVRWTVGNWTIDEILKEIAEQDEDFPDVSTVQKALKQLQQFDLPYRNSVEMSFAKSEKDISVTA